MCSAAAAAAAATFSRMARRETTAFLLVRGDILRKAEQPIIRQPRRNNIRDIELDTSAALDRVREQRFDAPVGLSIIFTIGCNTLSVFRVEFVVDVALTRWEA